MISPGSGFFITGGTLRSDAPSYVERKADNDLFEALMRGEFCYVLTSRQMGKSSLMVRTAARLRSSGKGVASVDLTAIGQNVTPEQWYEGMILRMGRQIKLEEPAEDYWIKQARLSPVQRFVNAIQDVFLARLSAELVIFVDEIDSVRSLPFRTDEFFAAIRECYNRRTEEPPFRRLTFCLLGVATPSDLIRESRTTPFNIGRRIELSDFTRAEAARFAAGLKGIEEKRAGKILDRILHWTRGHPYLTQRLCEAMAEKGPAAREADVDQSCRELFLAPRSRERDDNLLFVRERLLRSEVDRATLLTLYRDVRNWRKEIRDEEANPFVDVLRLSGVTRHERGRLKVRNRIYEQVFDGAWIQLNMPGAEVLRQRRAFRRGIGLAAALAGVLLMFAGTGAWFWWKSLNAPAEISIPARTKLSVNAYKFYVTAVNAMPDRARIERFGPGFELPDPAQLPDLVGTHAKSLRIARDGFQHTYRQPMARGDDPLPPLKDFVALAQLFRWEGVLRAGQKDWAGAVDSHLDAMRLGFDLPRGAPLAGRTRGNQSLALGRHGLWPLVLHLDGEQARTAARRLESLIAREVPMAESIQEELWDLPKFLAGRPGPRPRSAPDAFRFGTNRIDEFNQKARSFFYSQREMAANVARYYNDYISLVRMSYASRLPEPPLPDDPMSRVAIPNLRRIWVSTVSEQAQNHLLLVSLALQAYYKEHDSYPGSLSELIPDYLSQIPEDPFALSGSFRYLLQGSQYLLYSVGPDGKDDSGKAIHSPPSNRISPESRGDIVAGQDQPTNSR